MRFFRSTFFLSCIISLTGLWGCSPAANDLLVLEVGPEKISLEEYERFYQRNAGSWEAAQKSSLEDREKFLDLLTNYKLKLRDAYTRNLLNEPDVQAELREYRANVAATFLVDKDLTEPALRTMYERRKEELRASHILIRVNPNAAPEETLKAWNRAMDIIKQIKEGKDFGALAAEFSEDPSARKNKGDLYYFTGGQMVTPFEHAAYALKVGEVTSNPVRSNFGYHVIKLVERKPAVHSMKISHIMVSAKRRGTDSTSVDTALQKIRAIQDSLKAGHDFAELAKRYSEDPGSAAQGGSLGYFQRRRFVQEFEEAAFKLNPGEISDIVKTKYGYHLIKCDDVRPLPPYEELRGELQKTYQQYRYNEEYRKFVDDLRQRIGFIRHDNVLGALILFVDSTKAPSDSLWAVHVPPDVRREGILTVGRRTITVDSLIAIMSNRSDFRDASLTPANFPLHVDKVGDFLVLEAASVDLEERHPEFKNLMKEFQDGVVLYKAEQLEVWNKIDVNETKLKQFFTERRDQFTFPNRIEIIEISAESESLALKIAAELYKGRDIDTVISRLKAKSNIKKTMRGLLPADTDDLTQKAWAHEVSSILGPVQYNNRYVIMKVVKKEPSRTKTFEEASAEVSTAFQDYESKRLEREWLERLRKQYPVVQYREHLAKAFTGEKPST